MGHVIVGTAGHIDHGKTALVRALTGIETDTLPEEQARGVTIDIGFAYWKDDVTIIDVPGHERFVKNMVTGACSVDLALFVVAADDGPMPQTREHLGILNLLGVRRGIVALTKCDLVESDWVELVSEELKDLFAETFLDGAPIVPVSSTTGEGIDGLRELVEREIAELGARSDRGVFRLPVDRAFSVRGFGTVVTGTVISGRLTVKDAVTLMPSGKEARVRGLQKHGEDVEAVEVGARAAVNLGGVELEDVERGDLLTEPGYFESTYMIDTRIHMLPDAPVPLRNRERVHLHLGPGEVLARVILLDRDQLMPGEEGLAQLRLEAPAVTARGDRFVIRRYSPVVTLGGGTVLDALPTKHRRNRPEVVEALSAMESTDPTAVLAAVMQASGFRAQTVERLAVELGTSRDEVRERVGALVDEGKVTTLNGGQSFMDRENWDGLRDGIVDALQAYHQAEPMRPGIRRAELRDRVAGRPSEDAFEAAVQTLVEVGDLAADGPVLRLASHQIQFTGGHEAIRSTVVGALEAGGTAPPDTSELAAQCDGDANAVAEVLAAMQATGEVVKVDTSLYFLPSTLDSVRSQLVGFLNENGEVSVSQFRDVVGASRKYAVPLLNFFDNEGTTERQGDVRVLRAVGTGATP